MSFVDLNSDLGEEVGDDAAMFGIVTSANVACGFHAGGGQTMLARRKSPYQQTGWESNRPATRVCMAVDAARCQTLVKETLARPWLQTPLVIAPSQ